MIIYNIYTNEEINLNDKTPEYIMALITSLDLPAYDWACSDEDMKVYGLTRDLNVEEAMDLVRAVHEKTTAEATKKPTVQEVMDMEKKYREVIFTDLVQNAVFCDNGQTSEDYAEKHMDAMRAWKNLEAHLGDDSEGHKLYDEYITKVNVAVSTLLCDVYRKALHDSLTISETLELCQWFEKTKIDYIFDELPTI